MSLDKCWAPTGAQRWWSNTMSVETDVPCISLFGHRSVRAPSCEVERGINEVQGSKCHLQQLRHHIRRRFIHGRVVLAHAGWAWGTTVAWSGGCGDWPLCCDIYDLSRWVEIDLEIQENFLRSNTIDSKNRQGLSMAVCSSCITPF